MLLTTPRYELYALEGTQYAYSSRLFYDLCEHRDQVASGQSSRWDFFVCELGYIGTLCLAFVESVVRAPLALIALFSEKHRKLGGGVYTAILTSIYSLYAVFAHYFVDSMKESLVHFDIYFRPQLANSFLFQACEVGQRKLAQTLIRDLNANPHTVWESTMLTPALLPHLLGHDKMSEDFQLDSFETGYIEWKRLAHWLSLKGEVKIAGKNLMLEGAPPFVFFESIAEALQRFRTSPQFSGVSLSQEKAELLQDALYNAYREKSYTKIAEQVQRGQLTFIPTGWKEHGICPVFIDGYLALCNRGNGTNRVNTIEVYKIDSSLVTEDIILEIFMQQEVDQSSALPYFYQTLPRKIGPGQKLVQDDFCKSFYQIAHKLQKTGTCSLKSKVGAMRFAWAMLLDEDDPERLAKARDESKIFTDWAAVHYVEEARLRKQYPENEQLMEQLMRQATIKLARLRSSLGFRARLFSPVRV